ncbi:antibiotic biosynthesis monooxygenase [Geminocystis herdmanii]|uniref:antibiotic biosynthesis monooxygenase n=1 Tax=Geminocystis herdmanii TaxID=669359 RepID=UPI000349AE6A|nr:antibiotic biosynthesis monooxygenase [Geminocystis herdmanii]
MSGNHDHGSHHHGTQVNSTNGQLAITTPPEPFIIPSFSDFDRYNPNASYNKAPSFQFPSNIGLPLTRNFDFEDFIKTISGNDPLNLPDQSDLPFYPGIPALKSPNSYQWDSFPAGEAQQFLTVSVDIDKINVENTPLTGDGDLPVELEAISTSELNRPFTVSTTVTPFNAGPIPHIHWAEDEWFIILQGEVDSWVMSPTEEAYDLYEFPADENGDPLTPPQYDGPPALAKDKIKEFYYAHLTAGQAVFLPRGYGHGYRNASPTGEPLVFLTIWSRDIANGYPEGGIEEFFTLPEPRIGRFYDTAEDAAQYGSLYNKTIGSEDATSNQQRFVDYKNTFPDYYVAMSGNYGDFLESGGNWNPAIYKDYEAFPLTPPDYWNPTLDQPWNTDQSDPDADLYYPAPAPNAPSDSVNFSTPFDPQVINRIYITLDDSSKAEQLQELLAQYTSKTETIEGNFYSEPYQDPNNPLNYFIVEYWNEYSDVDVYEKTNTYQNFISQIDAIATTSTTLDTINPVKGSLGAVTDITLVGRFKAKPDTREEMISILTTLQEQTLQEEGALIFEFYENPLVANEWILFQKYADGPSTTFHFSQSYFKQFDSEFGLLLEGNGVADGSAIFYVTDEPASSFYDFQKAGLNILTELFESSPELTVSLETDDSGILKVVNGANTSGIGIVLNVNADFLTDEPIEYGIFAVDNATGSIEGLNPDDSGYLEKVRERASTLFTTINAEKINSVRDVFVETAQEYAFYQVTNGTIWDQSPDVEYSIDNENFFRSHNSDQVEFSFNEGFDLSAQLNGPIKSLNGQIGVPQTEGFNILDTSTLVHKSLTAEIHLLINGDNHPLNIGFYPVLDYSGTIIDPTTGDSIDPSNPNYASVIMGADFDKISLDLPSHADHHHAMEGDHDHNHIHKDYEIMGGEIYAPFVTFATSQGQSTTYFAYNEANPNLDRHFTSLGENGFGIEDNLQDGSLNDVILELDFRFTDPPYTITNNNTGEDDNLLTTPMYRFRTGDGTYMYVGEQERQSIRTNFTSFVEEGEAFKVATQDNDELISIYRFRNTDLAGAYIYVGEEERQSILANFSDTFVEEGLAFYAYGADAQKANDIFRFQTMPGSYLYVGEEERQSIAQGNFGFTDQGIAFEALT